MFVVASLMATFFHFLPVGTIKALSHDAFVVQVGSVCHLWWHCQ
jgi:hypothetical protein